ncbi:hypothetical protein FACS189450_14140 [Spirochaetia bacterium]|nr:hypothetical protein FACS189450_14140 [Spirochaetia bacterium]
MESKMPILSICIPTYNRIHKLQKLIMNILNYPSESIEVIVVDNRSTDNTIDVISGIKDRRLFVYQNDVNIGSIPNGIRALSYSTGIYSMYCLDKDWIETANIEKFINILEKSQNIVCGYCNLDILEERPMECFPAGLDGIMKLGYLSKHPSGYFFKSENMHNLTLFKKILSEKDSFVFFPELITAELASTNESCIINMPLAFSANYTAKFEPPVVSKTYHNTGDNAFFKPINRIKETNRYMLHAYTLDIPEKEKKKIIYNLFWRGLVSSTIGYKAVMSNEKIRIHYSVDDEQITILKLILLDIKFCVNFLHFNLPISIFEKLFICVSMHLAFLFKKIKKVIIKGTK